MTVKRKCRGGCGHVITYQLKDRAITEYTPDLVAVGTSYTAFAGGLLCSECAQVVWEALTLRAARLSGGKS